MRVSARARRSDRLGAGGREPCPVAQGLVVPVPVVPVPVAASPVVLTRDSSVLVTEPEGVWTVVVVFGVASLLLARCQRRIVFHL